MRNFGDRDNLTLVENIFSFEDNRLDDREFEYIDIEENHKEELYSDLE